MKSSRRFIHAAYRDDERLALNLQVDVPQSQLPQQVSQGQIHAVLELIQAAAVTSAATLGGGELETIKAALRKRFGREVEVETAIDESLIGGALIDAGDVVIDGSIRGKLERLQSALSN